MSFIGKAMTRKYIEVTNLLDSKLDDVKNNELGAVNMIEIVIIVVVLLAVMVVFREALIDLIKTAFNTIKEKLFSESGE